MSQFAEWDDPSKEKPPSEKAKNLDEFFLAEIGRLHRHIARLIAAGVYAQVNSEGMHGKDTEGVFKPFADAIELYEKG